MALGGGFIAGAARVVIGVETGGLTRGLAHAERQFKSTAKTIDHGSDKARRSINQLTDSELKMKIAQDKLTHSVTKFGRESHQAASATLSLRRAERQAAAVSRSQFAHPFAGKRGRDTARNTERAGRGALMGTGALRSLGRAAAFASTSFIGGYGLVYGIKTAVNAASDLEEQISKTNVVFGKNGREVIAWSKTMANAFGISERSALTYAGSFGALLRPLGVGKKRSAGISTNLVERAADIASFYNTSEQDALQAIQSGLVGQVRPLRRFGVQLSEDRVKAVAFASGIAKGDVDPRKVGEAQDRVAIAQFKLGQARKKFGAGSVQVAQAELTLKKAEDSLHASMSGSHATLTAQQKTLARYKIILQDTRLAAGDFARTSGHLAQQQKKLGAQIEDIVTLVGKALMPTVLHYTKSLTHWLGQSKNQARVTRSVKSAVHGLVMVVRIASRVIGTLARTANRVAKAFGGWENAAKIVVTGFLAMKVLKIVRAMRLLTLGLRANGLAWLLWGERAAAGEAMAGRGGIAGGAAGGAGGRGIGRLAPYILAGSLAAPAVAVAVAVGSSGGSTRQYSIPKDVAEGLKHLTGAQLRQLDAYLKKHNLHAGSLGEAYVKFPGFRALVDSMVNPEPLRTADDVPGHASLHATKPAPHRRRRRRSTTTGSGADDDAPSKRGPLHDGAKHKPKKPPLIPYAILDAVERAKLTKGFGDDLKALGREETYLKKRLAHTKKNTKLYHDLLHALTGTHSKIEAINKKKKEKDEAGHSERMAFIGSLANTFYGEFAPNIYHRTKHGKLGMGSKTVHVTQNFSHPPTSHFVHYRAAEYAARHAL